MISDAMMNPPPFWGDRYGVLSDKWGKRWGIASHNEDVSPAEMRKRGEEAMKKMK